VATEALKTELGRNSESLDQREQESQSLLVEKLGALTTCLKMVEKLENPNSGWMKRGLPRDR
jgi:hypothetical protein